jgi:hypothetical protein
MLLRVVRPDCKVVVMDGTKKWIQKKLDQRRQRQVKA